MVGGAVVRFGLIFDVCVDRCRDDCMRSAITREVSTTVLSETRATPALVLVIRGGLWLGECLGELPARRTFLLRLPIEPSARIDVEHRGGLPHP